MPIPEMALSPVKSLYWEVFPSMATQRVYCTPVLWAGRLYVLGGCSENGLPLDSAEVLDLESQRWCELPPLPTARAGASAVAVGEQLMVMGGMDAQQSPLASVEVYHPDEGKWERKTGLGQASMGITTLEKGKKCLPLILTNSLLKDLHWMLVCESALIDPPHWINCTSITIKVFSYYTAKIWFSN